MPLLDSTDEAAVLTLYKGLQNAAYKVLAGLSSILGGGQHRVGKAQAVALISQLKAGIPSAAEFEVDNIVNFLKKKTLITVQRNKIVFKPLIAGESSEGTILFAGTLKSVQSRVHYVCLICTKGFTSTRGLADHQRSKAHLLSMEDEVDEISADGEGCTCPLLDCSYSSSSKADVIRHLKQDKVLKVDSSGDGLILTEKVDFVIWHCEQCSITMPIELQSQHCKGKKHRRGQTMMYYLDREILKEDKEDVEISMYGSATVEANCSQKITFQVKNMSETSEVTLISCASSYDIPSVILSDVHRVTDRGARRVIEPKGWYEVVMDVKPVCAGITVVPLVFSFQRSEISFQIMKEESIECVNNAEVYNLLRATKTYERPKRDRTLNKLNIVESDFIPEFLNNSELEMTLKLDKYPIPAHIHIMLRTLAPEETIIIERLGLTSLEFSNYSSFFNSLLYLEEQKMKVDIGEYTMRDVKMTMNAGGKKLIRLQVPGLAENRPSVLRNDRLFAIPSKADGNKYEGKVDNVTQTEVFLGFHGRFTNSFIDSMRFTIEFTVNRLPLQVVHRAVTWAGEESYSLQNVLFPDPSNCLPPLRPGNPEDLKLKFRSRNIESNEEQMTAVKHIVAGTSRPAPYLIYGPPGTGKTFTLVEAIKQVYREFPESRILACAPQNAAADLVTKRLLDYVDKAHILRVHALSRSYNDIDSKVLEVSNYKSNPHLKSFVGGDREIVFPSKSELKEKRIIVVTLVTSGRFVSAEMTNHFTHIFVDEAGHATEPETIVPLANLLNADTGGQVILAGDPKQLGPIIRSTVATRGGLGVSLLERLMSSDVYKRDVDTNQFNPRYVTKLVQSFRSHPQILKVPNDRFYSSELKVMADELQRERFCHWEGLPTKGFPLIFHGVNGIEEQEEASPSWFNRSEVDVIQHYIQLLMECKSPKVSPDHIGIISPYHQQVKKTKQALGLLDRTGNYEKIKVGSVEKFQGDEREVIIISTVRSQIQHLDKDMKFNLGFVKNPKRFNVAITRAKALLIVIGNPAILGTDENWRTLIQHIRNNGGYTGCPLPANFGTDEAMADLQRDLGYVSLEKSDESFDAEEPSPHQQSTDQEWRRSDA